MEKTNQDNKNSVTKIKNPTGCFVDRETGKIFFTAPVLAMAPTRQSVNPKEKLALFLPAGNTCQAAIANSEHLENSSLDMYQAFLGFDSAQVRKDLVNMLPRNDFINNRAMDDTLKDRVEGDFWSAHDRNSNNNSSGDVAWKNRRLNEIKRDVTRVGITEQINLLAPNSSVNTVVDFSMNGFKDTDVWNTSTNDFENKFNNSIAHAQTNNYEEQLLKKSRLYYQHWFINDGGKLNTCFGDTSVESLRYILLKETDHYVLSSDGSVYDLGFIPDQNFVNKLKECFLFISCNKISVNGEEVDLNNVDSNKLGDNNDPINLKVNELINNLKNILQVASNCNCNCNCNYSKLYLDKNILYDTITKRFAFVDKYNNLDIGDASGFVYTMLMDIIESMCLPAHQLRYNFFIGQDQINDWVQMPVYQSGSMPQATIAKPNSENNEFSFSQHLQRNGGKDKGYYTSLYKKVKEHKDAGKILKFIQNTFKFLDEYSIPPNMKEKLVFNEEETKKIEESAKNANYLAYFFKEEYLTEINKVIQKLSVSYTDDEKRRDKDIWLKNYYAELVIFLNRYDIGDVLTEQGKEFFDAVKGAKCFDENEKNATISSFRVTSDISCNFNKQINAIDFSLFNSLLDVKNTNSGSRKNALLSKIRLYANYFFRNNNQDAFRTFMNNIGKRTKDAFLKKYFEYTCKKEMLSFQNKMREALNRLSESDNDEVKQQQKRLFDDFVTNELTRRDFRECLREYFSSVKDFQISPATFDEISAKDLIEVLDSDDKEIKELIGQCQKIMDDAYESKIKFQTEFNSGKYSELGQIYQSFHKDELQTFNKEKVAMDEYFRPRNVPESKRIFLNSDVNEINDDIENAIQEFDENLINELVESACGKLGISTQAEIEDMKQQCISEICRRNNFCVKDDFVKVFCMLVMQNNGVKDFDETLSRLILDYKKIDDKITKDHNKQDILYKDMVSFRNNEEFKNLYLAWQSIQWMVYLVQIFVYDTYRNDPTKLATFKNNKHNLKCHLRNGNFDRVILNKGLSAADNLIGYLLSNCITEQDKIKSITVRVKLDLADILELTSESDQSTQYNLWLANKDGRKIEDGILSNDTNTTTNALYFPVQSVLEKVDLYNNFFNSLSKQAKDNMGKINQESTLWLDEKKYRIVDIDEFFWEYTARGETLKTLIAYGQWNQIRFGSTLNKERKEQASSQNGNPPEKPLTLQERQDLFDEFASLLRYDPLNFVSSSLQTDKSQSTIFQLINDLCRNYRDNHRLGDFFDLIENVFLKKYKCMDINTAIGILEEAWNLDKYADGNVNANSDNPVEKRGCPIILLRENDSSIKSFGLQDGYEFELSIDFIINVVKHTWIPDISQVQSCLNSLFAKINNFSLVFCEEKKNADKNKRKELILLLYILYTVSTNVGKQKQEFNIVGDYENGDMKIEFYQSNSFNQFLQNQGFFNLINLTQQFQTEVKEEEEQKQKDIEIQKKLERLQKEKEDQQQAEEKEQNIDEQVKEKDKVNKEDEQNDNNKNGNEQNENIGEGINLDKDVNNKKQNNANEFNESEVQNNNEQSSDNNHNNGNEQNKDIGKRINLNKDVDNKNQNDDDTNNSAQIKEFPKVNEHNGENKENLTVEEQIIKYWMLEAACWDSGVGNEDIKQILKECISKIKIGLPSETPREKKDILVPALMDMHKSKRKIDIGMLTELWGLNEQEEGGYEENNNQGNNNQSNNYNKFEENGDSNNQNKKNNINDEDNKQNINLNKQNNLDNLYHENNNNNNEEENSEKKDKVTKEDEQNDNKKNNGNEVVENADNSQELQNNSDNVFNNAVNNLEQVQETSKIDEENEDGNDNNVGNLNKQDNSDNQYNENSNDNENNENGKGEENEETDKLQKFDQTNNQEETNNEISEIQNNNRSIFGNPKNRRIAEGVALILFVSLSVLSRFIFPAWLLYIYISIIGMLISGGLLGGNIWRSRKTNEEKDMNKIVSTVKTEEVDDKLEESQETNNQNQNNKTKPNIETDGYNVNQVKVGLNDEHLDE